MKKTITLSAMLLIGLMAPILANPYDDCILEHMGTTKTEEAVYAIERACISKTTVPITETFEIARHGTAWADKFNTGFGYSYGLKVMIKNTSPFNITELVIAVQNRKTGKGNEYVVDQFDAPLNGMGYITKLAPPEFENIIRHGETKTFFVPATEVTEVTVKDFFERFTWDLRLLKGIPAGTP